jgi:hypothetical protein
VLLVGLICDGHSIPLLSHIAPPGKQNNGDVQKAYLSTLARTISPDKKVIIITDAGFKNAWFRHIKSLGWDFVGRIRGNTQLRLECKGDAWLRPGDILASSRPEHLGPGTLSQAAYARCDGHFIFRRQNRKGGIRRSKQVRCGCSAAKEP